MKRKDVLDRAVGSCGLPMVGVVGMLVVGMAVGAYGQGVPTVFVTNYLVRGYPTTLPQPGEEKDTIELFASLGEYEPATFSVRTSDKAINAVKAAITDDLVSEQGHVISKDNVDIRVVEFWKRWLTSEEYLYMERYLQKKAAVDIPPDTTQRFWLTVHVPDDARAGIYYSEIVITAGETTIKTLTLKVEVLPLTLISSQDMGYFMYFPNWGIPENLRTQEYLEKIFVDMREHGMATASLYLFPWATVNGEYQFTFDHPGEYGQFAFGPTMDVLRDTRLLAPGMPAIWIGADMVGPYTWKRVLDEAKERNWPELVFYMQDEPYTEERIENARRLMEMLDEFKKQYPEYESIRTTTAIDLTGIEAVGQLYDIWICWASDLSGDRAIAETAKQTNILLWSYDCRLGQVDAETSRYYFGLWAWKAEVKGCSLWAYSDWQNPAGIRDWDYIDEHLDEVELDFAFVYPSSDGPVPSIGWEAIREGIDDHRYLTTLTIAIENAKAAGREVLAEAAEKVVKEIVDKVHVENYVEAAGAGAATGRPHGENFDRPSPEPEISKDDYNRFRYVIAQEIMKLQREHTVTISSRPGGSVTSPGEGVFAYDDGDVVHLVATPDPNYYFVKWTGTGVDAGKVTDPTAASTTITVDGDYTVQANFRINQHTVTVTTAGPGSVTLDPSGGMYDHGTKVKLTATPDADFLFSAWSGDLTGSDNPATITMDTDKAVTASFVQALAAKYTLTVNVEGQGSVTLDPAGGVYDAGTVVTLTAIADENYELNRWSGTNDDSSTDTTNTVTMTGKKTVTVEFALTEPASPQVTDTGCWGTAAPLAALFCLAFVLLTRLRH